MIRAFDDLDLPVSRCGDCRGHFRPLISSVSEDALNERKTPPRLPQQITRSVTVLNIGGQHAHAEQEAERVDEDVALAARDFLARIKALRVNFGAPFWAAFADWLSMIAALGLASRPAASRTAT